jgi:hypothetical protein
MLLPEGFINCSTVEFWNRNLDKGHPFPAEDLFILFRRHATNIASLFFTAVYPDGNFGKLFAYIVKIFVDLPMKLFQIFKRGDFPRGTLFCRAPILIPGASRRGERFPSPCFRIQGR